MLYYGERRWHSPTEIADLIVPVPGGLEACRPDFRYLLLDEGAYEQSALTADRNLAAALFAMEHAGVRKMSGRWSTN